MIVREFMKYIFFIGFWTGAVLCQNISHCDQGPCGKGQFYSPNNFESDQCKPCEAGMYMNQSDHACTACYNCQRADNRLHQVASIECSPEADTVITCQKGFYRDSSTPSVSNESGQCYPCSECGDGQSEVRSCSRYEDTQCESMPNMTGEDTSPFVEDAHEGQVKWKGQEDTQNEKEEGLHPALRIFLCLLIYVAAFVIMFVYLWFILRYVLSTTAMESVQQSQELEQISPDGDDKVEEIE